MYAGQKQLRHKINPPREYRTLRKALREGFTPSDLSVGGLEMYRHISMEDGISEREAYGWMLGYPPDFGVVG